MAQVLALSGGVGGAKLALGLADTLDAGRLAVVANTADDFRHHGLYISPDIDTLLYTLSGRANVTQGWGLEGESWNVMTALEALGGASWFRLGDRDLATHLFRSGQLASGASLSSVTAELARRLGVTVSVLPMSDQPVATLVLTDEGEMPFQDYFVRRACEPRARGFRFRGQAEAAPAPALASLLQRRQVDAVVICPSNPFVSVDPVLGLPGLWQMLAALEVPVVAVSPIIGGRAVKGPAAKMMRELGHPVSALGVMQHYCSRYPGLLSHAVLDHADAALAPAVSELGLGVSVVPTLMHSREDKSRLAGHVLAEAGV